MTTAAPTAIEMSKVIIDQIASAVSDGGSQQDAREALARVLNDQGGSMPSAPPRPDGAALDAGTKVVIRPNGESYHVRKIGKHDDVEVIRRCRRENLPILTYGQPGTGKTALTEAAFADDGFYTIQGSGDTEVADFVGGFVQNPDGSFMWVDGPLVLAMLEGKPLYIDEIALIDPKVLAVGYGVMDGRGELRVTANPERGVVKSREGFYVLASCNPNAPGARMSEALISRFTMQFEVTTDFKLAGRMGVHAKMVTAAQNLQKKYQEGSIGWSPQLRELLAFKAVEEQFGLEVALRNVIATAPEAARPTVKDIVSRTFSMKVTGLAVA